MSWKNGVLSEVNTWFVSNPFPRAGENITVSVRMPQSAPVKRVFMRIILAGETRLRTMHHQKSEKGYAYYSCDMIMQQQKVHYHFIIETDDNDYFTYNRKCITRSNPSDDYDFVIIADLDCPHWVRSAVFYQIFPDRFFEASSHDSVKTGEYSFEGFPTVKMEWGEPPRPYAEVHCLDFYGGDLDGIEAKIPYLKELGVTAVFANPIFSASSVHRYDCVDYFSVDKHLGGDDALVSLTEKLHKQEMKIIVDVSINHTGIDHSWMKTASSDSSSQERSFYYFDDAGRHAGWENVESLPQLNYASDILRKKIWEDENSVVQRYLKAPFSIDGWRFDVGNFTGRKGFDDFNAAVFTGVRTAVKKINSEAFIVGECWIDAQEWLQGDTWDSNMNYAGAARPIRRFLGGRDRFTDPEEALDIPVRALSGSEFAEQIISYHFRIPNQFAFLQFNLLDSHDLYRLHTFKEIIREETYRGAVIMLYLLPGAPSIYYGDEVGIDGSMTPNEGCRFTMPWDKSVRNMKRFDLYRKMNELKTKEAALHDGCFTILFADEETVVAARFNNESSFISVFSRNEIKKELVVDISPVVLHSVEYRLLFAGGAVSAENGVLRLALEPFHNELYISR